LLSHINQGLIKNKKEEKKMKFRHPDGRIKFKYPFILILTVVLSITYLIVISISNPIVQYFVVIAFFIFIIGLIIVILIVFMIPFAIAMLG